LEVAHLASYSDTAVLGQFTMSVLVCQSYSSAYRPPP